MPRKRPSRQFTISQETDNLLNRIVKKFPEYSRSSIIDDAVYNFAIEQCQIDIRISKRREVRKS